MRYQHRANGGVCLKSFPHILYLTLLLQLLEQFKTLVLKEDSNAERILDVLKGRLLELDSLPPLCMETEHAAEERKYAMEVFEFAALLSVNNLDRVNFQRYMSCLKPYYSHFSR